MVQQRNQICPLFMLNKVLFEAISGNSVAQCSQLQHRRVTHQSWNGKFVFAVVTSTRCAFPYLPLSLPPESVRWDKQIKRASAPSQRSLSTHLSIIVVAGVHTHTHTHTASTLKRFFARIPPSAVLLSPLRTHTCTWTNAHTKHKDETETQTQIQTHCAYLLSLKITKWESKSARCLCVCLSEWAQTRAELIF